MCKYIFFSYKEFHLNNCKLRGINKLCYELGLLWKFERKLAFLNIFSHDTSWSLKSHKSFGSYGIRVSDLMG